MSDVADSATNDPLACPNSWRTGIPFVNTISDLRSSSSLALVACLGPVLTAATWPETVFIVCGTLLSEDLTCIGTGLLIRQGTIGWLPGLVGCFVGVYFGDLAIWLIGRTFGRKALDWTWIRRRTDAAQLEVWGRWFEKHGWIAVLVSRFLPGVRVPLYLAIGMLERRSARFPIWSFFGAVLWVPLIVGFSVWIGKQFSLPTQSLLGSGALIAVGFLGLAYSKRIITLISRRLAPIVEKWFRWEFWPAWLFYLPMVPWIAWLMLRYRSCTVWTAANPGIPHGGVVGESKYEILCKLPSQWRTPSAILESDALSNRLITFEKICDANGWRFPLIFKPDVGQRGAGVMIVHDAEQVARYLEEHAARTIIQTYHPGPFEAGVFYIRVPGERSGHIFSITDKQFPIISGDGQSSLAELILAHSRFRFQTQVFFQRHASELMKVLPAGETFQLSNTGNHCQGTMFLDGSRLKTPQLEQRFDEIAQQFDGFFFGRFDVRYRSVEGFLSGNDLSIVELNGVTSESTNLYDPKHSLWQAYSILAQQWSLLFRIGEANCRAGHKPTPLSALCRLVWGYGSRSASSSRIGPIRSIEPVT